MVAALRTPDERFADLPGWPEAPQYCEPLGDGLRMAYTDIGPKDAKVTALCLHGNPTWSYIYRHMAPVPARSSTKECLQKLHTGCVDNWRVPVFSQNFPTPTLFFWREIGMVFKHHASRICSFRFQKFSCYVGVLVDDRRERHDVNHSIQFVLLRVVQCET